MSTLDGLVSDFAAEAIARSKPEGASDREVWLTLPAVDKWQVPGPFRIYVLVADVDSTDDDLWIIVDACKDQYRGFAQNPDDAATWVLKGEVAATIGMFVSEQPEDCTNCMTGPRCHAQLANITDAVENMEKLGAGVTPKVIYIIAQDSRGGRHCTVEVGEALLQQEEQGRWSEYQRGDLPLFLTRAAARDATTAGPDATATA